MKKSTKLAIGIGSALTLVGLGFLYNKMNKKDEDSSSKSINKNNEISDSTTAQDSSQQKSVSTPKISVANVTKPILNKNVGIKKGAFSTPALKQYDVLEDKDYDNKIAEINNYREKVSKLKTKTAVFSGYRKLKDETLLPMNLVDLKDYLNLFYLEDEKGLDVRQKALKGKLEKKYPQISFPPSQKINSFSGFSGQNNCSDLANSEKLDI